MAHPAIPHPKTHTPRFPEYAINRCLTALSLSLMLAACGGGGGDSGKPTEVPQPTGATISGLVLKGPVAGARICAFQLNDDHSPGPQLVLTGEQAMEGCLDTGNDGDFSLQLPADAPARILLQATGGRYCLDEQPIGENGLCRLGTDALTLDAPLETVLTLADNQDAQVNLSVLSSAALYKMRQSPDLDFTATFETLKTTLQLPLATHAATGFDDGEAGRKLRWLSGFIAASTSPENAHPLSLEQAIASLAQGQVPVSGSAALPQQVCAAEDNQESQLRCLLAAWNVQQLQAAQAIDGKLFEAGRLLFTNNNLSGSRGRSCATCHSNIGAGIDNRPLNTSLAGGTLARNTPSLVNKGLPEHDALFWDGRVRKDAEGHFLTPVQDKLPAGLDSLLAAQALIPILTVEEMLGVSTAQNLIAGLVADPFADPEPIWEALMNQLKNNAAPAITALQAAYAEVPSDQLGIQHVANALAAFQIGRWNADNMQSSHFHQYIAGSGGVTAQVRRGAMLFFGKANCASCHHGATLSDDKFHNIGVPQIGPGFASGLQESPPRDLGHYDVSGNPEHRYAFLTPSLWEAGKTAPYMHNGVFTTLERTVRHHLNAIDSANAFRCDTDKPAANVICHDSASAPTLYADLLSGLAPSMRASIELDEAEMADLLAFLQQLTNGNN